MKIEKREYTTMFGHRTNISCFLPRDHILLSGNEFKLATKATPMKLIEGIAKHQDNDDNCMIQRLHFYPFGGMKSTLKWADEQI
jgi:hypothetical protein